MHGRSTSEGETHMWQDTPRPTHGSLWEPLSPTRGVPSAPPCSCCWSCRGSPPTGETRPQHARCNLRRTVSEGSEGPRGVHGGGRGRRSWTDGSHGGNGEGLSVLKSKCGK